MAVKSAFVCMIDKMYTFGTKLVLRWTQDEQSVSECQNYLKIKSAKLFEILTMPKHFKDTIYDFTDFSSWYKIWKKIKLVFSFI